MPNPNPSRPRATEIDLAVGSRIRARREMAGLSQAELAKQVGVTYQQMHKYERGLNRVAAGRLQQICDALGCSVANLMGDAEPAVPEERRRFLNLARALRSLPPQHLAVVVQVARALQPDFDPDAEAAHG